MINLNVVLAPQWRYMKYGTKVVLLINNFWLSVNDYKLVINALELTSIW